MRLFYAGLLLTLVVDTIMGKEVAAARHQRIIATPNGYDPLSHLTDLETRDHKVLFEGPQRTYHSVNVTAEEEDQIANSLKIITGPINGLIEGNTEIFTQAALRATAKPTAKPTNTPTAGPTVAFDPAKILSGIQRCKNTINNTTITYVVFILDGYIDTTNNALSGTPVLKQFNLVGATPGILKHGEWVAESLLGDDLDYVQASGIKAIGITVFGDDGTGNIFTLLSAAQIIKQQLKNMAGQGVIFGATFSGVTSTRSLLLDTSMAELSLLLPITGAAGNVHAPCSTLSPPDAGNNVIAAGGTEYTPASWYGPASFDVAYDSTWGCSPNMFYTPYCVYLNAMDGTSNTIEFCGTSESTPNLHRIFAYIRAACPTCTIEQATALLRSITITFNSSVGPISVFPAANVCPLDNDLFASYKSTNGQFSTPVDATTLDGKFCATMQVQRSAKTPKANIMFSVAGTELKLAGNNKAVNKLMKKNGPSTLLIGSQNNLSSGTNHLAVYIQTNTGFKLAFSAAANNLAHNVSVGSGVGGDVTFTKARKCLLGA